MPDNRILVKMRLSTALAADSRANVRPLRIPVATGEVRPLGASGEAEWYLAELPDTQASPWDTAHARVADQLGVDESDVLFVEPDLVHNVFPEDGDPSSATAGFAIGADCKSDAQSADGNKVLGPNSGWHLDDNFSQLAKARAAVAFSDRRTRIAHFDTGYFAQQITVPKHLRHDLERNFVDGPGNQGNAADPDNRRFLLDNSGHGTGTISILAGQAWAKSNGLPMGAAPDADIVPLRVADSVVLLRTSAFATALDYAVDIGCDVGTMSMGGLPSRAWRDSIDRAYLAGFCLVAAAGNCTNGLPTRHVVYPARFGRVIAACGAMANGHSYSGLKGLKTLEGNYGPDHVMGTAISAYTPNIWWARFGCTDAVRENGEGTSSATPQVAAAVALWFEKFKGSLPRDFRRVEAVRHALFTTAKQTGNKSKLGNGIIQAFDALGVQPRTNLPQTASDNISFSFLRVLTGLGISEVPVREGMFNLEIMQRLLTSEELRKLVPDPDEQMQLDRATLGKVLEVLIEDGKSSLALRRHLADRYSAVMGGPAPRTEASSEVVPAILPACESPPDLSTPNYRRLRVYAADPSLSTRLDSVNVNEATLDVRWEKLEPGPVGEYVAVVDKDASGMEYRPVDLDDRRLLAQNGWAPSEGNPQFHQQMTYAVAMTTISHFERALGRPVLWRTPLADGVDDSRFIRRLEIRPHAVHQANAFYSPQDVALRFGYFEASADLPGEQMPGSRVYTCLSHDIIAHETTHAILDGMHRRFIEATNVDMPAFHEGFADIVSLFQHFTMREPLRQAIARTRGDLASESALGSLAVQFGNATGRRGALRDAIGRMENGVWKRFLPDPADLQKRLSPHSRGAILVAAVFDAYLAIYKTRVADLIRIYTQGTGVLPDGAIHPDLVNRLAGEAAKVAGQVLTMCIRALDYLPPVDVTLFDYLRALITADFDFVPEDPHHYRIAFVEAFRARGIYPLGTEMSEPDALRTLSVDTVRWESMTARRPAAAVESMYKSIIKGLRRYADASIYCRSREELFNLTRKWRATLHDKLKAAFKEDPEFAKDMGLDAKIPSFEVHSIRRASRSADDGRPVRHLIIALTQSRKVAATKDTPAFIMRGGSTLVVDLGASQVNYRIFKNVNSDGRTARTAAFALANASDPVRRLLLGEHDEPFAALHSFLDVDE